MLDALYVRGWDDCLEAVEMIILKVNSPEEMKSKIAHLKRLVKEDKFKKIRNELGAFNIF